MPYFDVCNGDADGLCAVVQWRLAKPQSATLVTGLKRDIALLDRVVAKAGDQLLVCDISMRRNLSALLGLLACGAEVSYFDHHEAGTVPSHPRLHVHVAIATTTCTSLLVSEHLGHPYRHWALVGAYGDQLDSVADALAAAWGVPAHQQQQLRTLGQAINHNAYGDSDADVGMAPARLYDILKVVSRQLAVERNPDGTETKGRIFDGSIDTLRELIGLLDTCNLTNDPSMQRMARDLSNAFEGITSKADLKDADTREETKRAIDAAIAALPSLGW